MELSSGRDCLNAIRHIDHVTYVSAFESETRFLNQWKIFGFDELVRLQTLRFPASHIALVSGKTEEYPWETMTGLSVSEDPESPVNEFVRRYGEGVQHVAYNIHPQADMEALHRELVAQGWSFMTPVLTYKEGSGARLRQMFVAPQAPYGPFVELVQRLLGPEGAAYNGFDVQNIDDLYQYYADYSRWLEGQGRCGQKTTWRPAQGVPRPAFEFKGN
jgi:4-hydroxyphenylpyruvate dioxygenase-like putative hemolysin